MKSEIPLRHPHGDFQCTVEHQTLTPKERWKLNLRSGSLQRILKSAQMRWDTDQVRWQGAHSEGLSRKQSEGTLHGCAGSWRQPAGRWGTQGPAETTPGPKRQGKRPCCHSPGGAGVTEEGSPDRNWSYNGIQPLPGQSLRRGATRRGSAWPCSPPVPFTLTRPAATTGRTQKKPEAKGSRCPQAGCMRECEGWTEC